MEKESRRKTRKNRNIQTKIGISLRNISRDCIRSQKDSRISQLIFLIFLYLKKEKTKFYNEEFISKKTL
jgi:dUTPase